MKEETKYWFAVKVKSNTEIEVFNLLIKNGYKVYMPILRFIKKINEKEVWKMKPIFRSKLFVFCKKEELLHLQSLDNNMKFFFKGKQPDYLDSKHIQFIKKALSSDNDVEIINKVIHGTDNFNIHSDDFGELLFYKSIYREKEVVAWNIPVVKNTLILNPESIFLKFLIYESEEAIA